MFYHVVENNSMYYKITTNSFHLSKRYHLLNRKFTMHIFLRIYKFDERYRELNIFMECCTTTVSTSSLIFYC